MSELTTWDKNLADDDFFEIHPDACSEDCGEGHCGKKIETHDMVWFEPCGADNEEAEKRREIHAKNQAIVDALQAEEIVEEIVEIEPLVEDIPEVEA